MEPPTPDHCSNLTDPYSLLTVEVTTAAMEGEDVVVQFTTSFPVGQSWSGDQDREEVNAGVSGAFYTDNGLELIRRHRDPP